MSLEDFYIDSKWGNEVEKQTRLRIQLSVYAYAYEVKDTSLIDDHKYDKLSLEVNPTIETGNKKLDDFFKKEFDPSTGQWIHKHPELDKVVELFSKYYSTGT